MDNKNLLMFREFYFLIFLLVVELQAVLSADKEFEACLPYNCGTGPNITYPFWINGKQNSSCGFPGFGLFCKNREPILNMSGEEYLIREIFHGNQSFFITKLGENEICSPLTYRLSFARLPFTYVHSSVNLSIFFNCSASFPDEYSRYSFGCANDSLRRQSLALFSDDPIMESVRQSGECETSVVTPVVHFGNGSLNTVTRREYIEEFLTEGFYLKWNASSCDECAGTGGRCGFNYTMYKFMCFCADRPHNRWCRNTTTVEVLATKPENNIGRKIGLGVGTGIGSIIVIVTLMYCWKMVHISTHSIMLSRKNKKDQMVVEDFLKNYGSLAPKRYNYHDIKKITNSFKNKIGQGGYGVVYKGKLDDGRFVAVKLLDKAKADGEEFMNEVASISRTSHVNVVSLLGFCFEGSKRALIYEFMANGSLEKFIYDHNDQLQAQFYLEWKTLYQITIGVARGLEYLHRGCNTRILHFDIKPHNILLDQDFTPKISDFGLAKLCPRDKSIISMLGARGTAGYIAPEVFSRNFGGVSHKSDVYSYGMMVLEIVGRRKNIDVRVDHTSEIYFPHWIYKRIELDEDIGLHGVMTTEEEKLIRKMILVALWCIQTNPVDRPTMTKVVEMLEGRLELLSTPPKPYLCSPARDPVSSSCT